jgi:anti-sigma B factor antagonist
VTSDILTVTAHDGPAGRVLVAAGEIDRDSRCQLRDAADRAIGGGHHRLVVDLAAVTFCDSSGLSLLVDLHRETQARGGGLRLTGVPPLLRTMLGVTHLDRLFELDDV